MCQELLEALSGEDIEALEKQTKETQIALDESRKSLKNIQTGEPSPPSLTPDHCLVLTLVELNDTMALPKTKDLAKTIEEIKNNVSHRSLDCCR